MTIAEHWVESCGKHFQPIIFRDHNDKFHTTKIYLNIDEVPIANEITRISEKFAENVAIGSYPKIGHRWVHA